MRLSSKETAGPALALAAALLGLSGPAAAQRFTLSPTVGMYLPTTSLVEVAAGPKYRAASAVTVGARAALALTPRFGLEASLAHTPADREFTRDGFRGIESGHVLFGTVRAAVNVLPSASRVSLRLSGGPSVIHRGGDALYYRSDNTDVGGVVGAALAFDVTDRLNMHVSADDYVYRYRALYRSPRTGHDYATGGTQHDLHLSVGFGLPLGR